MNWSEKITVTNEDNMQLMARYPDKYFDLAIVDPPYGININHSMGRRKGEKKSNYKKADWDKQPPPLEYFYELFRVSKNQIVWGANHFISRMPYDSACWLLFDKKVSEEVSFAQYEMAWTSLNGTCKKFEYRINQRRELSFAEWRFEQVHTDVTVESEIEELQKI